MAGPIATIRPRVGAPGVAEMRVLEPPRTGAALAQMGDDMVQAGLDMQKQQRLDAVSRTRLAAADALDQAKTEAEQSPDIDGREELYGARAKAARDELLSAVPDHARGDAGIAFDELEMSGRLNLRANVRAARRDQGRATLDATLDTLADQASRAPDPDARRGLMAQGAWAAGEAYAAGHITAEEQANRINAFTSNVQDAAFYSALMANPSAALAAKARGDFAGLDPKTEAYRTAQAEGRLTTVQRARLAGYADQVREIVGIHDKGLPARSFAPVVKAIRSDMDSGLLDRTAGQIEIDRLTQSYQRQQELQAHAQLPIAEQERRNADAEAALRTRGAASAEDVSQQERKQALTAAQRADLGKTVDAAVPVIEGGRSFVGEEELIAQVQGTDLAPRLQAALAARDARRTPPDQAAPAQEPPAVGRFEAAALDARRDVTARQKEAFRKNPLDAWADVSGGQRTGDLNLGDPDAVRERIRFGDEAAAHGGVQPMYLQPAQAQRLAEEIETAEPAKVVQDLSQIQSSFGSRAPDVLRQLGNTAEHVALAGHYGLLGNMRTARDLVVGARMMKEHHVLAPGTAALRDAVEQTVGGALMGRPDARGMLLDAATAIYLARAPGMVGATGADQKGDGRVNRDLLNQAIQDAFGAVKDPDGTQRGGIAAFNGRQVVLPSGFRNADPWYRSSDFERAIDGAADADLQRASVGGAAPRMPDGKPFAAEDLKDSYLVAVDDGLYRVSLTDPQSAEGPSFVHGSGEGGLYELDFRALTRKPGGPR